MKAAAVQMERCVESVWTGGKCELMGKSRPQAGAMMGTWLVGGEAGIRSQGDRLQGLPWRSSG